jgi:hypothetical protein
VGAGGSDGGVRVPLAAMVMVKVAVRDARTMALAWNALRTAEVVVSASPSPTCPCSDTGKIGLQLGVGYLVAVECLWERAKFRLMWA